MSDMIKKSKAGRGQNVVEVHGRDNSSYNKGNGKQSFGGSVTNLEHSLGTSAKVQGTGHEKPNKFD